MITEQEIHNAYQELAVAKSNYELTNMALIDFRAIYDSQFAIAVANGELTGKNETERKGQFETLHAADYDNLRERISKSNSARLLYDLATIEVEKVRALLRLAEVLAKIEPE